MTSEHSVSKKEPLVHISKRDRISFGKAWGIRIIAVLISLVVCAGCAEGAARLRDPQSLLR